MSIKQGNETRVCDHEDPCGCYAEGYAQGKNKAHFEIRGVLDAGHADDCGCEPCLTSREVLHRWFATGYERTGDPSLVPAIEEVAQDYITKLIEAAAYAEMVRVLSEDPNFDAEASDAPLRMQADLIASTVMASMPRVNREILHIIATALVGHSHQAAGLAESFARDALALGRLGKSDGE